MWLTVMKLKFILLLPSYCEFEYHCVIILITNTLTVHCIWISVMLIYNATTPNHYYITLYLMVCL